MVGLLFSAPKFNVMTIIITTHTSHTVSFTHSNILRYATMFIGKQFRLSWSFLHKYSGHFKLRRWILINTALSTSKSHHMHYLHWQAKKNKFGINSLLYSAVVPQVTQLFQYYKIVQIAHAKYYLFLATSNTQIFPLTAIRSFSWGGAMCVQTTRAWGRARVPTCVSVNVYVCTSSSSSNANHRSPGLHLRHSLRAS